MQDEHTGHMYPRGCGRRWKHGLGLLDSSVRMLCNDLVHQNSRKRVPNVKKVIHNETFAIKCEIQMQVCYFTFFFLSVRM